MKQLIHTIFLILILFLGQSCQSNIKKTDRYTTSIKVLELINNQDYDSLYVLFNHQEQEEIQLDSIIKYTEDWSTMMAINTIPLKDSILNNKIKSQNEEFEVLIIKMEYHHALFTFRKENDAKSLFAFELHENGEHQH